MSHNPILAIEGARKAFGGLVAVNDVSFDVREGELVGAVAPELLAEVRP